MMNNIPQKPPFTYKTTPFNHQHELLCHTWDREYYAVLWEMGTGKSKYIVDNAAWLYKTGKIDGLLIFAPKGAYLNWVFNEVPKHMTDDLDYRLAYWNSGARKRERMEAKAILTPDPETLDIFVMNTEAMSHKRAAMSAYQFLKTHNAMICIDESTDIKTPGAKRTKTVIKLRDYASYRRVMTGTPITQSPLDLYAQFQFLKRGLLGHSNFFSFKNYYAIIIQMRLSAGRSYPKITGYRNIEELKEKIKPYSSRLMKVDCLDLPEKIFSTRYVELTSEQQQAYNEMVETCIIQFESEMVTATSALTALTKLHQVICGHCKTETGDVVEIPNNRIKIMMDEIACIGGKVIVWCNFVHDVKLIARALREEYGDESVETYYGDTLTLDRALANDRFEGDDSCRFMVSTSAGSKSNTWIASHNVIYYSYSYKLIDFLQSQDRNHRIGQRYDVNYISLVTPGTIDEKIIKSLQAKQEIAGSILNDWGDWFRK